MKKALLFILASICILGYLAYAQDAGTQKPAGKTASAKQARWEGMVTVVSKDNSTLTVRKVGGNAQKVIHFDSSTKWVSQEHGSKTVNNIDASQVKDGDRVICTGTEDKDGFHATLISKRLTPM